MIDVKLLQETLRRVAERYGITDLSENEAFVLVEDILLAAKGQEEALFSLLLDRREARRASESACDL